ncbi:MAG: lysine--tRNA ligase, partial [Arthrobacter sp.]
MTSQNTSAPNTAADSHDASEQTRIRMEKRAKLIERGVEAYPVGVERTHSLGEIREKYAHLQP